MSYFAVRMDSKYYKKFYDKLNTLFQLFAALSILIFAPIWMYIESKKGEGLLTNFSDDIKLNTGLLSIILSVLLTGYWHYQYHRSIKSINSNDDLLSRLNQYKHFFLSLIVKMTVLSALISAVYLFVGADAMIAAYALLLVLISMNRITFARIARQLKMNKDERDLFFGNDVKNEKSV